jgi:hypothetical protein
MNMSTEYNGLAYIMSQSIESEHPRTNWPDRLYSGVPRNFFFGGCSTNSVEDREQRERGSGGGSPLVMGSGGSCNLVQEISFHIVNFSYFLVL